MKKKSFMIDYTMNYKDPFCGIAKDTENIFLSLKKSVASEYKIQKFSLSVQNKNLFSEILFYMVNFLSYRPLIKENDNFTTNSLSYFIDKILGLLGLKVKINTEFIDIFYCFNVNNYILKPNTIKIIRIHDLIPITNPTLTSSIFSNILFKRNLHFNANETNTYFVCNSEYTKHELLSKYPNLKKKCYVIPCNIQVMSSFKTALITKFLKNYQDILNGKFLFSVSTLEPKKNLYNLLCAWEKLIKNNPHAMPLILVANAGWGEKNTINKLSKLKETYPNKLIHLQHLHEEIIQLLFYKCTIFIMPSKVEGFGIPVLNAIKYHKPLILSDIKVFREIAVDAAIYFNPNSVNDIYTKILSIISKSNKNPLLTKLSKKSAIRSKQYTNEKLANQWRATLKNICKNTNC